MLEARTKKLVWCQKSDKWSVWLSRAFSPLTSCSHVPDLGFWLLMLANCVFADRILSEYGVRDVVERGRAQNGFIYTGFCFFWGVLNVCSPSSP